MKNTFKILWLAIILMTLTSCAKSPMSDRDIKLQQQKNNAENKRKELLQIAAIYRGTFTADQEVSSNIKLVLEIKDVPSYQEGQVDPVMVPTLTGYMRIFYSESEDKDYENFAIQKADYDINKQKTDIVLIHDKHKEIFVTLSKKMDRLAGTWTAPSSSVSGTIDIKKSGDKS
jgi:Na+-transporting NADH:ubiquinone oxidoreductase subunit NqrC